MDVDEVEEEEEEDWWEEVAAVYPTTKCYYCQGFGHMARDCPKKGKGKGDKGGGKGGEKGKGGKGWYGKGSGEYAKGKGGSGEKGWKVPAWKGGGKNAGGKGWKGGGKGYGYQGTCFTCGQVGHKAAECGGIYEVQGGCEEDDAGSKDVGGVRVVAGVEEMRQKCGHDHGCRDGSGHPGLPTKSTMLAFMPKRTEVENSFKIFQVDEEEDEEMEEVSEVVEITVDSGASRSVWPR